MFLPLFQGLEKIDSIDLKMYNGANSPLYQYRAQVVMHINEAVKANIDEADELQRDIDTLIKWFGCRNNAYWWNSLKKQMSPSEACSWILENAISDLESFNADSSFRIAAGVPTENELEDALTWSELAFLQGSEKQVAWARSIMQKHLSEIAFASKTKEMPTSASWWIKNRTGIFQASQAL